MFLTNNTMLGTLDDCCVVGFHGAGGSTGAGLGKVHSNSGSTALQTYVFAAYTTPGTFKADPTPGTFNPADGYFVKDVYTLSHEVVEWATDPFLNNTVEPWFAPTAPQYGCSTLFETGDPVFTIGFNVGANTFDTNAYADGSFHASDEAFLPWFARQAPNTLSQTLQGGTTGRYTFMGTLNPSPVFHAPATGC
jgi:hypothetical protein